MSILNRVAPLCAVLVLGLPISAAAQTTGPTAEDYRNDARSIDGLIAENYAYLDRFPSGQAPMTERLRAEADAVHDSATLLRYAERRLALLADAHVITGSSFSDSWAIVPSYADLWIEPEGGLYRITAVRDRSPAQAAGVRAGDRLIRIGDAPVAEAVWRLHERLIARIGVRPTLIERDGRVPEFSELLSEQARAAQALSMALSARATA